MASLLQVCLALLLVSCVHGQEPVYLDRLKAQCKDGTSGSRLENCRLAFLKTLDIPASAGLTNISIAVCNNNIPAVVTLYGCLRSTLETCLSSEYQRLLKPDAEVRDQFQYFCDHKKEINPLCAAIEFSSSPCSVNAWNTYNTTISQIGLVRAICNYLGATRGCLYNSDTPCPSHNRDVFDTYWVKSYPPACAGVQGSPPVNANAESNPTAGADAESNNPPRQGGAHIVPTSFLLLGACAVLLNKMAAVFLF